MSEDNKQFMRRFVEEIINKKNLAAIDGLVSEDFVEHVPFPDQDPGREGLKHAISTFVEGLPAHPVNPRRADRRRREGRQPLRHDRDTPWGVPWDASDRQTGADLGGDHRRGAGWEVHGKPHYHGYVGPDAAARGDSGPGRRRVKAANACVLRR